MSYHSHCKECGEPILWARVYAGKRWIPLVPEILGAPKPDDFPLNVVYFHAGEPPACLLVKNEATLDDLAELHRDHRDICPKRSAKSAEKISNRS